MEGFQTQGFSVNHIDQAVTSSIDCLLDVPGLEVLKLCIDKGISLNIDKEKDALGILCGKNVLLIMQLSEIIKLKFPERCRTNGDKLRYYFKRLVNTIKLLS